MRQINIKVSDEEYDLINANAALLDKTITAYVKELALNQNIINPYLVPAHNSLSL